MPRNLDELREIEQLLRDAEERLGPCATFRQRTLLQMSLFELWRGGLRTEEENVEAKVPAGRRDDGPDER